MEEALTYDPDVLLLQETPQEADLLMALRGSSAEYELLWGEDAALVARGSVTNIPVDEKEARRIKIAEVILNGHRFFAVSVHLSPAYRDPDLLAWRTWAIARRSYIQRTTQTLMLTHDLSGLDNTVPQVVGGDFNSTAGDSVLDPLRPRLRDTFSLAGIGLGNTVRPALPLLRVDYIFVNSGFRTYSAVARDAATSDHRMVISDLGFLRQ